MPVKVKKPDTVVHIESQGGHEWFRLHSAEIQVGEENKSPKWVAASGVTGVHNVRLENLIPDAPYKVTLHFMEPEEVGEGERVFDIYIQGERRAEDVDIISETGGHDGNNQAYGCKGGLVRLPFDNEDILLYSHPDIPINHDRRCNVSVWASFDGGQSWPIKRSVYKENCGYSMLAAGRPDTPSEGWVYIVFIDRNRALQHYARFNLSWILGGELTGLDTP